MLQGWTRALLIGPVIAACVFWPGAAQQCEPAQALGSATPAAPAGRRSGGRTG